MLKFRHYIHLLIAFFSDSFKLVKALFYQIQCQHFRNEVKREAKKKSLCILGNGASLSVVCDNYEKLSNYEYCVVNYSINTDIFWKIKPVMYILTDRVYYVFKDRDDTKTVREKMQLVDWPMGLYIPYHFPKWIVEEFKKNQHIKVCRYSSEPWSPELGFYKKLRFWFYKKGLIAPNCSNVIVPAIYCAILKGYKRIYLFGVEHSWIHDITINDKNEVVLVEKHYYGSYERVWVDYDGKPIKITDLLESNLSTFNSYHNLKSFADYLGDIRIVNCTKGSFIDAFERGKLENLINGEIYVE